MEECAESQTNRQILQNFDLTAFTEDSMEVIEKKIGELASQLGHSGCTKEYMVKHLFSRSDSKTIADHVMKTFPALSEAQFMNVMPLTNQGESQQKRKIIAPKMLGLNTPEHDLDQLSEFERISSKKKHDEALKRQDNLKDKLTHFMSYLAIESCQSQINGKSDRQLIDKSHRRKEVEWLDTLVNESDRLKKVELKLKNADFTYLKREETFINPTCDESSTEVSIEQEFALMKLAKLKAFNDQIDQSSKEQSAQMTGKLISNEILHYSIFKKLRETIRTPNELLNIGQLDIMNAAHDGLLSPAFAHETSDVIRSCLGLAALTQDVNFLLHANLQLAANMLEDFVSMSIDKDKTDDVVSKEIQLSEYDLIREFKSLPTFFPQNFTVGEAPSSNKVSLSFQSKIDNVQLGFVYIPEQIRWSCGTKANAVWVAQRNPNRQCIVAIDYERQNSCILENSENGPIIHFDMQSDGKAYIATHLYGLGLGGVQIFVYLLVKHSRPRIRNRRASPIHSRIWQKFYEHRKDSDQSFVYMGSKTRGHLLTVNSNEFKVRTYNLDDFRSRHQEVTTASMFTLDVDTAISEDYKLVDFKVTPTSQQYRLLFQRNFRESWTVVTFDVETGDLVGSLEFAASDLNGPDQKYHLILGVCMCEQDELQIRIIQHGARMSPKHSLFKLEDSGRQKHDKFTNQIENPSQVKEMDFYRKKYYEDRVCGILQTLKSEVQDDKELFLQNDYEAAPKVTNLNCMYLLSQVMQQFSQKYLVETRNCTSWSPHFLQSNLSVRQTPMTFTNFKACLQNLEKLTDTLDDQILHLNGKNKTLKKLEKFRQTIGLVYHDTRMTLACNIHAILQDGRSDFIYPVGMLDLIIKLNVKHQETLSELPTLNSQGLDFVQLFTELITSSGTDIETGIQSILDTANKLNQLESDDVLQIITQLICVHRFVNKDIFKIYEHTLEASDPTKAQTSLVQAYLTHQAVKVVSMKSPKLELKYWIEQTGKQNNDTILLLGKTIKGVPCDELLSRVDELACTDNYWSSLSAEEQTLFNKLYEINAKQKEAELEQTQFYEEIKSQLIKLKDMVPTKMNCLAVQILLLTMFMKKDLQESPEMIQLFIQFIKERKDLPKPVLRDFFWLVGRYICDLIKPAEQITEVQIDSASSQIIESELLSGGLQPQLFGYFSIPSLQQMATEATIGSNADLLDQINDAISTLKDDKFASKLNENDKMYHEIIHADRNPLVDLAIRGLQYAIKKKGGLVSSYCNAGQENGLKLTRAAFAVMLKFSRLQETFQLTLDSLDCAQLSDIIPKDVSPEQDKACFDCMTCDTECDELVKCWANATQMRKWLIQKKQSLSIRDDKIKEGKSCDADQADHVDELLEVIYKKIIAKAEFLVTLQTPTVVFKQTEVEDLDKLQKRPSYMVSKKSSEDSEAKYQQESIDSQHGKLKDSNEIARQLKEASSTSVLACLQSPIQRENIIHQIMHTSRNAIRRISAFRLIEMLLQNDKEEIALSEIVAWFTSYQNTSTKLLHYTDGVKGCGMFLEQKLRSTFFNILSYFAERLRSTNDQKAARSLLHGFDCKFLARDFGLLHEQIKIFSLFFRGGNPSNKLIKECQSFYIPEENESLVKTLRQTLQDVYLAIIARISEKEAIETMSIKQDGFTSVPTMAKKKSVLDQNWSELLVGQALDEMFRVFQQVVIEKKRLSEPSTIAYLKEQDWFSHSEDTNSKCKQDKQSKAKLLFQALLINGGSSDVSESFDLSTKDNQAILNDAQSFYDKLQEKSSFEHFFGMIYLLTNVAQVAPIPLKMLKTIATPYHLLLLFELLLVCSPNSKLKIIKIIQNLLKNQVPIDVFKKALEQTLLSQNDQALIFTEIVKDPCVSFFYTYATQIRESLQQEEQSKRDQMIAVSKQLLKLCFAITDRTLMQKAMQSSIMKIDQASQCEQDILLEMMGAPLGRIFMHDEVKYVDKFLKTKPTEFINDPMIVVRNIPSTDSTPSQENQDEFKIPTTSVTVFKSNAFVDIIPSQLKLITLQNNPENEIELSVDAVNHLINLIVGENPNVSDLTKAKILKYFTLISNKLSEKGDKSSFAKLQAWLEESSKDQWLILSKMISNNSFDSSSVAGHWSWQHDGQKQNGDLRLHLGGSVTSSPKYGWTGQYWRQLEDGRIEIRFNNVTHKLRLQPDKKTMILEEPSRNPKSVATLIQPLYDVFSERDMSSAVTQLEEHLATANQIGVQNQQNVEVPIVSSESVEAKAQEAEVKKRSCVKNVYRNCSRSQNVSTKTRNQRQCETKLRFILHDLRSEPFEIFLKTYYALQKDIVKRNVLISFIHSMVAKIDYLNIACSDLTRKERQERAQHYLSIILKLVQREALNQLDVCANSDTLHQSIGQTNFDEVNECLNAVKASLSLITSSSTSLNNEWKLFQVISDIEWAKYKKLPNESTHLQKYYSKASILRQILDGLPSTESRLIPQLLLSKLSQHLLFTLSSETSAQAVNQCIATYRERKMSKLTNYVSQDKQTDGSTLLAVLQNFASSQPSEAVTFYSEILKTTYSDLKVQMFFNNSTTITDIDLIRKIACMITTDQLLFSKLVVETVNILATSISILTSQVESECSQGNTQRMLLVRIRKVISTLHDLFTKLEQIAEEEKTTDVLQEISQLESLSQLLIQLPLKCTSIRSLFQFQLGELGSTFRRAATKGGRTDIKLANEALVDDLERVKTTLKRQLTNVDNQDQPQLASKIDKKVESLTSQVITLDNTCKSQLVNGWYKVELKGANSFEVILQLEEKKDCEGKRLKFPSFVAISDKPEFNAKTKTQQIKGNELHSIKHREGTIFLKYPLEKKYNLTLAQKFERKSQDEAEKRNFEEIVEIHTYEEHEDIQSVGNLHLSCGSELLMISEDRRQVYILGRELQYVNRKLTLADFPVGEKIKTISKQTTQQVFVKLMERQSKTKPCNCAYNNSSRLCYTLLSESGKLYNYCFGCYSLQEYPFIHTGIQRIEQFAAIPNKLLIVNDKGQLFDIEVLRNNRKTLKAGSLLIRSCMDVALRDDSTLKKVHKVWLETNNRNTSNFFGLIEATTTDQQHVMCSIGNQDEIGRLKRETESEHEFHILEYEPDLTVFTDISVNSYAAVGVDQDGEVWILCGTQRSTSNLNLPVKQKHVNTVKPVKPVDRQLCRPIQTNWMSKAGKRAIKAQVGTCYIEVMTEDLESGAKGISIFKGADYSADGTQVNTGSDFSRQHEEFFDGYENHIEILDMFGYPLDPLEHRPLQSFFVVKPKISENFTPLVVEIKPSVDSDLEAKTAIGEISEEKLAERDSNLKQVNQIIAEKLKRQGKKVLQFLDQNRTQPNIVQSFLKMMLSQPQKVITEEEKRKDDDETQMIDTTDKQSALKDFIKEYIKVSQLLYDLIPLVTYIYEDPYLESNKAGTQLLNSYLMLSRLTRNDLIQRIAINKITSVTPASQKQGGSIYFNRLLANSFLLQNRHEKENESLTAFTMLYERYKDNMAMMRLNSRRPFTVKFIGEGACDCGGPMREAISSVCKDLMSDVLPLLVPTSNNEAKVEPCTDCFRLNPTATQPFVLKKFMFFGYFLGWSLRNLGGLGIDLPLAFWKRVCGGLTYCYTMEDLESMDVYRFNMLTQYIQAAKQMSDEEFDVMFAGYFFDGDIGYGSVDVELCKGGSKKSLKRDNVHDYVKLYLKAYTEQENLQFIQVYRGIEDVCGKRMLLQMLPHLASRRACASSVIDIKSFKALVKVRGGEDEMKMFWEVFEEFQNEDRQLLIKFATGRTRLAQGEKLEVHMHSSNSDRFDAEFPHASTCSNSMSFPSYSTKEIMRDRLLFAFRYCGEIDGDGGANDYGQEVDEPEDEDDGTEQVRSVTEQTEVDNRLQAINFPDPVEGTDQVEDKESIDEDASEDNEEEFDGVDDQYVF